MYKKVPFNKTLCKVVRVAKDPFHNRPSCGDLRDQGGTLLQTDQEKCDAFQKHNFIRDNATEPRHNSITNNQPSIPYRTASDENVQLIQKALLKTRNNSAPGPDRISYRLLKLIKDTHLGQRIFNDIAKTLEGTPVPSSWRAMSCVMIPKPNNDHNLVKGWRPIVLSNCIGKLAEKVVADRLQRHTPLFHPLQYGSRKHRSAIDSMMVTLSKVEDAHTAGNHATLSAVVPRHIADFVFSFLSPRKSRRWGRRRSGMQ